MKLDFKNIHIGNLVEILVKENNIDMMRICNFMHCTQEEIEIMYQQENFSTDLLLKWSTLLEYDFFRIYSHYLILFAPPKNGKLNRRKKIKTDIMPQFRKNLYTKELIDFILELIETNKKTKSQVIEEYKIPKTTLYNWMEKYRYVDYVDKDN